LISQTSFLLDTNAVTAHIKGDQSIKTILDTADELFMSVIVLGELYFGAENSV
jgi:predicted nucleic acid-binding protein